MHPGMNAQNADCLCFGHLSLHSALNIHRARSISQPQQLSDTCALRPEPSAGTPRTRNKSPCALGPTHKIVLLVAICKVCVWADRLFSVKKKQNRKEKNVLLLRMSKVMLRLIASFLSESVFLFSPQLWHCSSVLLFGFSASEDHLPSLSRFSLWCACQLHSHYVLLANDFHFINPDGLHKGELTSRVTISL